VALLGFAAAAIAIVLLWLGGSRTMLEVVGWLAGLTVQRWIADYDHWIAFGLLGFVGGKMIYEAIRADEEEKTSKDPTRGISLVLLSVATSIDALAVGLSLAMLGIGIWLPALVIGLVAGAFTVSGMLLGRRIGAAWGPRVEVIGGLVLCAIGLKILLEHTIFVAP
jgi:putative Mn2+ efflux pump MntP